MKYFIARNSLFAISLLALAACSSGDHSSGEDSIEEKEPAIDAKASMSPLTVTGPGGGTVYKAYQPIEISLEGPFANETDDPSTNGFPNPFLHKRLFAAFQRAGGPVQFVPGFFDGDGNGGGSGNIWKIRWVPDAPGMWTVGISFRQGATPTEQLALTLNYSIFPTDGVPASPLDGFVGQIPVRRSDPNAPGFFAKGNLEYVGEHYPRFTNGQYWVKGGVDSPENLLGYRGFDQVTDLGGAGIIHQYGPHLADYNGEGPYFTGLGSGYSSEAFCGAINYLSAQGTNSLYFMPMNLGGDGQDTCPFVGYGNTVFNKTHYDISRMHQWNQIFRHAQEKGILLHFQLAEKESNNISWLDAGNFGTERKLYFRELIARFGYLPASKWTLCEENVFSIQKLRDMAAYLQNLDYRNRIVAVHTWQDNFNDYDDLLGDPNITATSIQYTPSLGAQHVETWRANSAAAGHRWIVEMDENGQDGGGIWGIQANNLAWHRKQVLYSVLFSGGGLEWYCGSNTLPGGGDTSIEDFRSRHDMWVWTGIATKFLRDHLPFAQMSPMDSLVQGENGAFGGAQAFVRAGTIYAVYLPNASAGGATLDLTGASGSFEKRWFNPRTGAWEGSATTVGGGGPTSIGLPPSSSSEDWVVLFQRL